VLNWKQQRLQALVDEIRRELVRFGLSPKDLEAALAAKGDAAGDGALIATATEVIEGRIPSDLGKLKSVADAVNELLDFGQLDPSSPSSSRIRIPESALASPAILIGRWARQAWAAVLVVFVSYIVVGGILDGRLSTDLSPALALGLLALLIVTLGIFEGLQMSVGRLGLKDLGSLRERYPRAYNLHKLIRTTAGTNRFLAGRQLLVIVIVFLAARLTSFPPMETWPFTTVALPGFIRHPLFQLIFSELGVLGAFFVLWIGQLAPQFIATKRQAGFLNLVGMGLALRLCFFVESLGLAMPGDWLAKWVPEEEYIPPSPEERYRIEVGRGQGFGTVGLKKYWTITQEGATLEYRNALYFTRRFNKIIDRSLVLPATHSATVVRDLAGGMGAPDDRKVDITEVEEEQLAGGRWKRIAEELTPNWGPFLRDDVLLTRADIQFAEVSADHIGVIHPTMYIAFRAMFTAEPDRIDDIRVQAYRIDETLADNPRPFFESELELKMDADGCRFVEFAKLYPEVNTYYVFTWDVRY
jgi:hypothetical protein